MARFESCIDQLAPDQGQLMDLRAQHIDALAAGDLGIEPILLRNLSDRDELLRRDFAGGDQWSFRRRREAGGPAELSKRLPTLTDGWSTQNSMATSGTIIPPRNSTQIVHGAARSVLTP